MGNQIEWREVAGVVENVHDDGIQKPPPPTVYWPFAIANFNGAAFHVQRDAAFAVRSPGAGTEAFLKQVRQAVAAINPGSPVVRAGTLQEIYGRSMAQTSFALVMPAIAGGMALVLGVIAVYGVIAYTVEQRRREVGIRMALGAPAAAVKWMFLRRGLLLAGFGIALGLAAAKAARRAGMYVAAIAAASSAVAVAPMETLRGE
jgi:predicted lysophospholipase L1 biosynthesis ABC-type transport system permease subunit